MSLAISGFATSHSSQSPPAASLVQNTYTLAEPAAPAVLRTDGTTVTISQAGRVLAANEALTAPTPDSAAAETRAAENISAAASDAIGNIFRGAGIDVGMNVRFDVDALGNLQISGVDGLTAGKIKSQLDQHPDVVAALHTLSALSV